MEHFTRVSDFLNSRISKIFRTCNLIVLKFELPEKKLCLHIQGFFRVLNGQQLLISSSDMFVQSKEFKKKKFKWDIPGDTLFDDEIKDNLERIIGIEVLNITSKGKDLFITLKNGIKIEVLMDTLEPEKEIYRIFESENLDSHLIVETGCVYFFKDGVIQYLDKW